MAQFPFGLQTLTSNGGYFEAFPKWTKPQLSYLTVLHLTLYRVAELPSLRFLRINSDHSPDVQEKLSSASGFPCLTDLELWGSRVVP
jgi:hypothetical protein